MKPLKIIVLFTCAILFLSGCKEELYTGLSEPEANEMVLTLLNRGIEANKVSAGKTGFSVVVEKEDFVKSLKIIKEHSLPRTKFKSLGDVFSGQGMISSQLEEQSRLAFALSEELSATFSKIDGVLDARVHVVLPQHNQAAGLSTLPSAAVFIRHVKDSPVERMVSEIKDTAARSVPGLTNDYVSVMMETYNENVVIPQKIDIPWYKGVWGYVGLFLSTFVLTFLICWFGFKYKIKNLSNEKKDEDIASK